MQEVYPAVESTQDILEGRKPQQAQLSLSNLMVIGLVWLVVCLVKCGKVDQGSWE